MYIYARDRIVIYSAGEEEVKMKKKKAHKTWEFGMKISMALFKFYSECRLVI